MRRVLIGVLAGAALLLTGVLLGPTWSPAANAGGGDGAATAGEPALECRVLDGERVCDTFGESDEGPGTVVPPVSVGEPAFECRVLDGERVCDTFGESDEGPGTR